MENLRGWLEFTFVVLQAAVLAAWFLSAKLERRTTPRGPRPPQDDALLIASEQLRMERAATVDRQLNQLHESVRTLHRKASDHMSDLQGKIGRQSERLAAAEALVQDHRQRIAVLERTVTPYEKD